MTNPQYEKHIFVCINQKESGRKCCGSTRTLELFNHLKQQLAKRGLATRTGIRASHCGCLGRCALGPNLVIYPDNVWYRYQNEQDIERIIDQHISNNQIVSDLLIEKVADSQ